MMNMRLVTLVLLDKKCSMMILTVAQDTDPCWNKCGYDRGERSRTLRLSCVSM